MLTAARLALIALLGTSGCSVALALTGEEPINQLGLAKGVERSHLHSLLGKPPTFSTQNGDGQAVDVWNYQDKNETSWGRATAWAVADVLTLGITELASTPYEAVKEGSNNRHLIVVYNENMEVETYYTGEGDAPNTPAPVSQPKKRVAGPGAR
jgi:hypothetical protein